MVKPFHFWGGLVTAGVLWGGAVVVSQANQKAAMPPFTLVVMPGFAVQDTAMALNGARRFGADLAFIQLMQYYGSAEYSNPTISFPRRKTPRTRHSDSPAHEDDIENQSGKENQDSHFEKRHERAHEGAHEGAHEHAHGHLHLGSEGTADATDQPSQGFPLLADFAIRAGTLDPRFHFAYLFASGALAFNLNRGEDAVRVLEHGIRGDPSFWRYRMYLGAISYRKNQETEKVIETLEQTIIDPDCPSMIKNILAHIYIKKGNLKRAAEIYVNLLESRDPSYSIHAENQLIKLGVIRK
jgi:tetratricopeptide (TPR) repeat protein